MPIAVALVGWFWPKGAKEDEAVRWATQVAERVAKLREQGVVPGLGTVLVGDDPGSASYVAGKHRDCAEVGIRSIRVDLPVDTSAEVPASRPADRAPTSRSS